MSAPTLTLADAETVLTESLREASRAAGRSVRLAYESGWRGAMRHLSAMSPEERKVFFAREKRP